MRRDSERKANPLRDQRVLEADELMDSMFNFDMVPTHLNFFRESCMNRAERRLAAKMARQKKVDGRYKHRTAHK